MKRTQETNDTGLIHDFGYDIITIGLNLFITSLASLVLILFFDFNELIDLSIGILTVIVLYLLTWIWIKRVRIYPDSIKIYYPTRILSPRHKTISNDLIHKAIWIDYHFNNPSHVRIETKDMNLRLNCDRETGNKISKTLNELNVKSKN